MPKRNFSLNQTAVVPKTGKVLNLREMVRQMARTREGLGVPFGMQKAFVKRQAAEFSKLQDVFSTYEKTGSSRETGRILGIAPRTVRRYVSGEAEPRILSRARVKLHLGERRSLKINKDTVPSLAYVFGAMLAGDAAATRDYQQNKVSKIYMQVKDRAFAQEFQAHLKKIGIKNKMARRQSLYTMTPLSTSLLSLFNKLTLYGEKMPSINRAQKFVNAEFPELSKIGSDLLALPEGRKLFVRGLFDGIGWIGKVGSSQTINVKINPRNEEMSKLIIQVLNENGITPMRRSNGGIVIPTKQTRLFLDRIGISRDNYPSKLF
jgi:hypothetical protein